MKAAIASKTVEKESKYCTACALAEGQAEAASEIFRHRGSTAAHPNRRVAVRGEGVEYLIAPQFPSFGAGQADGIGNLIPPLRHDPNLAVDDRAGVSLRQVIVTGRRQTGREL